VTNNLDRGQLRQDIRDANYAARRTAPSLIAWVLGVIVLVALLVGGIWGIKVATSGAKGAGDQTRQVNSGTNRIGAQEHFESLFGEIKAYDQQLDQAAADKAANPGDRYFAINYSGLVKQCIDARNQYDADANKVTQAKWRDPNLPYQIDATDPTTDCKEATK
jgi:FtsZ-interacting cell division protein ZipA